MIHDSRFIIVAGTARNVGKTTLVCDIIRKNSKKKILALKFITLKSEGHKHQHHSDVDTYLISEEKDLSLEKDTVKMLKAGADKSYLIISKEEYIEKALSQFLNQLKPNDYVIAESATLRKFINPKLFIIVDRKNILHRKSYINELLPLANFYLEDLRDTKALNKILQASL